MPFYVYYQVAAENRIELIARVRGMQTALSADTGCVHRLLHRHDAAKGAGAGAETWMEIYDRVPPDFEARLARAVEAAGLAPDLGPRHVERFDDIA